MNTPKIRFKGFKDDWEQRKVGEVTKELLDYDNFSSGLPLLTSSRSGLMYQSEYRGNATTENENTLFSVVPLNACTYRHMSDDSTFHLNINTLEKGLVSKEYPVFQENESNLKFIVQYINSSNSFTKFCTEQKKGGTRTRLYYKTLCEYKLMMPSIKEQNKTANFFDTLDHLITLHQRKCDETKQLKKFMLQKMFPKNGEKNPKIRFEGFTDDWEQRKFSELVTIERGGSPRPIDRFITKEENGLNWIKIGDAPEQGNYITKTEEKIKPEGLSKTREVHPGDLILSNSMSFGRPYILAIDGCIHDGWLAIRDTEKRFDLKFLCTLLGTDNMLSQYKAMAAGSTVNNLNKELVGATTVSYPVMDEQVKLGEFFDGIDHLITLHQRKCEKLKELKKYMLHNMFV